MAIEQLPPASDPYPNAAIAIAFVEETLMGDDPPDDNSDLLPGRNPWERVVALVGEPPNPHAVAGLIKHLLREIAAQPQKYPGAETVVPVVLKQCDHPEFLQYLAGKLSLI